MVVKFKGTYTKRTKLEIMDFIVETMSISSRVHRYAIAKDSETICRVIEISQGGAGPHFLCELQSLEPIYDGAYLVEWKRKLGKMDVSPDGRAKWVGGQIFVDKNGKELE